MINHDLTIIVNCLHVVSYEFYVYIFENKDFLARKPCVTSKSTTTGCRVSVFDPRSEQRNCQSGVDIRQGWASHLAAVGCE